MFSFSKSGWVLLSYIHVPLQRNYCISSQFLYATFLYSLKIDISSWNVHNIHFSATEVLKSLLIPTQMESLVSVLFLFMRRNPIILFAGLIKWSEKQNTLWQNYVIPHFPYFQPFKDGCTVGAHKFWVLGH